LPEELVPTFTDTGLSRMSLNDQLVNCGFNSFYFLSVLYAFHRRSEAKSQKEKKSYYMQLSQAKRGNRKCSDVSLKQ
jgi:hypothetical protein